MPRTGARVVGMLACMAAVACRTPAPGAVATADECTIPAASGAAVDTLVVAAPGPIDPAQAPSGRTAAERILFRQLYEPLIQVDCRGAVLAGLADRWRAVDGGRTWVFSLREHARFWDGVPVTAHDVVASWLAGDTAARSRSWVGPLSAAVSVLDDRTLAVRLDTAFATVPRSFADPGLAVAKRVAGLRGPLGTGPYWLDESAASPTASPLSGGARPVLVFRDVAQDPRDALDAGADVLLTGDAAALAYASGQPDVTTVPLPWDRTYVLLTARPWSGGLPDAANLAEEVVRVEARAAGIPEWWHEGQACDSAAGAAVPAAILAADYTAYLAGDPVARALAERLTAVGGGGARAVGYRPAEFAALLRRGGATAIVMALPRATLDPCRARRELEGRAPWLAAGALVPLIDVRPRLILRRPLFGVLVDWDGVPRWR